mgnify:FL=1
MVVVISSIQYHQGESIFKNIEKVDKSKPLQVPGNLIISAHSGSHSFDASMMNTTHYVSDFSFGRRLPLKMVQEVTRLTPELVSTGDHLPVKIYVSEHENITVRVIHIKLLASRSKYFLIMMIFLVSSMNIISRL